METSYSFYQKAAGEKKPNVIPTYDESSKVYEKENGSDDWFGRSIIALPNLVFSLTLKPAYHLASALFTLAHSVYKTVMESDEVKKEFNTIDQDLYEGWGYFWMLITYDPYGQYWVGSSQHQKAMNQGKPIPRPPPPIPKAPPPPPPLVKTITTLRRTNSMVNMSPDAKTKRKWKPAKCEDIQAMLAKIKREKKSEQERVPEIETPPGLQGENMLKSFLANIRKDVEHTPNLAESNSSSVWDRSSPTSPYTTPPQVRKMKLEETKNDE